MMLLGWHGLHKFHSRRRALANILYQSQLLPCHVLLHWELHVKQNNKAPIESKDKAFTPKLDGGTGGGPGSGGDGGDGRGFLFWVHC